MMSFSMNERGFTGLEAAIVLIAFVVVAAVFSYVVLGAGFFTTQTAQATVHTGVAQASSSLEVVGDVMGIAYNSPYTQLTYVNISVATTAGGTPMDLSQMVISYTDSNGARVPSIPVNSGGINSCTWTHAGDTNILIWDAAYPEDVHWCVSQKLNDLNPSSPNNLLEPNEIWVLSIEIPYRATAGTEFTIYFQPAVGAVLPITRTLPGALSKIQAIY